MTDDVEPISSEQVEDTTPDTPAVEAPSTPEVSQPSPWDSFKQLPEFQGADDRAIAGRLYQAMQREQAASRALAQYQQVMPIAQEYLTNRPQYQQWLEAQRKAQQPQPTQEQAAKKWWNPPELKDSYRRYLIKDESGRDVISPDAPLDARGALTDWLNYRADFAQKFLSNPEEALGPMVAELAQKQAQELIQKQLETRDNEAFVSSFEEQNKDWLYDSETGSVSPAGLTFHKYVEEAKSHGIAGPQARAAYATAMTERDLLVQKYELEQSQRLPVQMPTAEIPQPQQPAPQPAPVPPQRDQARQNMDYLRREASRNPSRSAGAANLSDPRQPRQKRSFEEMLLEEASSKNLL